MKFLGILLFSLIAANAAAETPCVYLGHDTIEQAVNCTAVSQTYGGSGELISQFAEAPAPLPTYYPHTSSLTTYFVITKDAKNYGGRNIKPYAPYNWYYYPVSLY